MYPIIKWPGGKQREYKFIKRFIPKYDRYIEPFLGGGAVFFMEEPQEALVNDFNGLLMDFYRLVKEQNSIFKDQLKKINSSWLEIDFLLNLVMEKLINIFFDYRSCQLQDSVLEKRINSLFEKYSIEFIEAFDNKLVEDIDLLLKIIIKTVTAKIKRMKKLEFKTKRRLSGEEIYQNIETGIRSGFYTHFRILLNDGNLKRRKLSLEKHIAIFYFIREFCYGSMFRYNSRGEFNIPYGGISYNNKDFTAKINKLFSKKIKRLFSRTKLYNKDFEVFLNEIRFRKNDFIFFDPPYDSDFSTYGRNYFGQEDHLRLARLIKQLPVKYLLVIKNTDFIYNLYNKFENINISLFDKLYSCNVQGRNDRKAKHLIIYNY